MRKNSVCSYELKFIIDSWRKLSEGRYLEIYVEQVTIENDEIDASTTCRKIALWDAMAMMNNNNNDEYVL